MQQLHHRLLRTLVIGGALLFAGAAIAEDNDDSHAVKQAECLQTALNNYMLAKITCDTQSANGAQQAYCLTVAGQNYVTARDACYADAKTNKLGVELTDLGGKPKKAGKPTGGGNHLTLPKTNLGNLSVAHVTSQSDTSPAGGLVLR